MNQYKNEIQYLKALETIINNGTESPDRTGTGTIRYSGIQMRFDLSDTFPILTTKKVLFYPMVVELLWFMMGRVDHKWLQDRKCNIWNDWSVKGIGAGTIGPGYGAQWRRWTPGYHDQLKSVIENIKSNPDSRRLIVNAWNVSCIDDMALPPCHFAFQFLVNNGKLDCILSQRSGDFFLGIPFNIASYALLTYMIAMECELIPGTLVHNVGDAHIYRNHMEQVETQLSRALRQPPRLVLSDELFSSGGLCDFIDTKMKDKTLEEIKELIKLDGYDPHPFIRATVAV